jgi:hypothetical protein
MSPTAILPIPRSLHVETLLLNEEGLTFLATAATYVRCPIAPTSGLVDMQLSPRRGISAGGGVCGEVSPVASPRRA